MLARSSQKVKLSDLGEFGVIDLIKKQTALSSRVIKGIGDDAAVIPFSSKKHHLFTADMLVEGVHFTLKMPAKAIGHKALACSMSDIAAMGGIPKYAVVSLGIPASCPYSFVKQVYQGMQGVAKKFKVDIVGGDTVKSKEVVINIALVGEAVKACVVYRSNARIGDHIFVTGLLGRSFASGKHLRFTPRVVEAQYLVKGGKPTAMIDISDGLVADLWHILSESRVGAILDEDLIPKRKGADLKQALYDGEDFELLFTLSAQQAKRLQKQSRFKFYPIGEIVSQSRGCQLKTTSGHLKKIDIKGYTHF